MGTDKHVVERRLIGYPILDEKYYVKFSDGTVKLFDPIELGVQWWQMSSDAFYRKYGFDISPWDIPEIYGKCLRIVQFGKGEGYEDGKGVQEVIPMGKKRLRDMNWDDYGISKNRYKELKAFCLQYDEKKSKIKYGISSTQNDGQPRAHSTKSQTEAQAIENDRYKRDCAMIEEAAVRANPGIWKYILKSVTLGLTYEFIEYDEELGRINVGKTDFYGYRKLFFHYLNKLKIGDKLNDIP